MDKMEIEIYNLYGQKIHSRQYERIIAEFSENIDMSGVSGRNVFSKY